MGRQANGGSGWRQENKRWSLIHGPRFLTVLLVISMIHVATSQDEMSTLDQGSNIIRSARYAKTTDKRNTQSSRVCNTRECIQAANEISIAMNLTVDPCDDFYEYACGRWPEHNKRPPGYSYYQVLYKVELKTEEYKRRKLEMGNINVNGATTEVQQMPSDLYHSCMNLTAIDNLGDAPLRERITELGGWTMSGNWDEDKWDFKETLLSMHKMKPRKGPVFKLEVHVFDNKKISLIMQAGPSLPRQQYLNLSSKTMLTYRQLIIDVVALLGGDASTTATKADEIIRLEAQLANVSLPRSEWLQTLTNRITLQQLQQTVPEFDWSDYLNKLFAPSTIPQSEPIIVPALSYLRKAMKIVHNTPKSILANYMVWYMIRTEIKWLSLPFRNVQLKYLQKILGNTTKKTRRKTCVESAFGSFEDLITVAYVQENHANLIRPRSMAKQIHKEAVKAFRENVNSLTWLDAATRNEAIQKVENMGAKIGFPDYMLNSTKMASMFKKYTYVTINAEKYFKNKVSILKQEQQHILKEFRKRPDKTLWIVSPLKGNAYHILTSNTIILPAAIIQPPIFFVNEHLRAYNLGNFGSFLGHEMMHGFGNAGRPLDKDGKKRNWWSKKSLLEFNKRIKCYEKQYSGYKILGKYQIDGKKTAEENVADSAGLKIALKAYYNWANQNPSEKWLLPGLNYNNEQLFYIGFAQSKCSSSTRERRLKKIIDDPHGDDKFRIIGSLANSCEFANAFKCKKNSPMNPVNKCYLWSKEGPLV